jgi:hypothetical protein
VSWRPSTTSIFVQYSSRELSFYEVGGIGCRDIAVG